MQKTSGFSIGTSRYWKRPTSAGFLGPTKVGFLHGAYFDHRMLPSGPPHPRARNALAVTSRLGQPSVVDSHCRQCLCLPRRWDRGAIYYVGEQCIRPDRTFAR